MVNLTHLCSMSCFVAAAHICNHVVMTSSNVEPKVMVRTACVVFFFCYLFIFCASQYLIEREKNVFLGIK